MTPLLLTEPETADVLRTDVDHVELLVAEGRLRPVRLYAGGPALFRPEDIVELVESLVA